MSAMLRGLHDDDVVCERILILMGLVAWSDTYFDDGCGSATDAFCRLSLHAHDSCCPCESTTYTF